MAIAMPQHEADSPLRPKLERTCHQVSLLAGDLDLAELRSRIDRALVDFTDSEARSWAPPMDVVREDGELVMRAEVPGVRPDEIEVEVEAGRLTVSGRHAEEHETSDEHYVRRERRTGSFMRSISLPEGCDASKIEATTRDGVLEIHIPAPTGADAKKIKVSAAAQEAPGGASPPS